MIKIVTGWSNPGGSTTAHINLTNLLNKNNIPCVLFGPHTWHLDQCKADMMANFKLDVNDTIIMHFVDTGWPKRPPVKGKVIYSCHEKNLKPIKSFNYQVFDKIHYVSEPHREWHGVDHPHFVASNVLDELTISKKVKKSKRKVAGIIGSIDKNKQTHISIQRALKDGIQKILLFGHITEPDYYAQYVAPLLSEKVNHSGFENNKQNMYDQLTDVYLSSKSECLSYVKRECELTGITFHGTYATDNTGYINISNNEILNIWKQELEIND